MRAAAHDVLNAVILTKTSASALPACSVQLHAASAAVVALEPMLGHPLGHLWRMRRRRAGVSALSGATTCLK